MLTKVYQIKVFSDQIEYDLDFSFVEQLGSIATDGLPFKCLLLAKK